MVHRDGLSGLITDAGGEAWLILFRIDAVGRAVRPLIRQQGSQQFEVPLAPRLAEQVAHKLALLGAAVIEIPLKGCFSITVRCPLRIRAEKAGFVVIRAPVVRRHVAKKG